MKNKPQKITPKLAAKWLTQNKSNRPLSQTTVDRYAQAMVAGEWQLNGDTIRFDENNNLIDGQHRLHACVKSGKSFSCYVVHNLPSDAFDTIDQGRPRTMSDVLARRGEKHYTTLAAAVRTLWLFEQGAIQSGAGKIRPSHMDDVLKRHPGLREAVQEATTFDRGDSKALMPASRIACLWYLFNAIAPRKNKEFWERVVEGVDLKRGMPEALLRNRLISNLTAQARLKDHVMLAFIIKAWNASLANREMRYLKWQDTEEFPKIEGLQKAEIKLLVAG